MPTPRRGPRAGCYVLLMALGAAFVLPYVVVGALQNPSGSSDDGIVAILAIGGVFVLLIFVIPFLFGLFKAAYKDEATDDDPPR